MGPKISIVTISFNQARYLEEAIRSVVGQSYRNVEYIIVDAGSTDGSRGIIEQYREEIDVVIMEPDRGPAHGLNKGFSRASGEVFGFLNSDDVLESGALASVARVFEQESERDVVSGHCFLIDDEGQVVRRGYSDRFSLNFCAYGSAVLMQPSTFFRRECFLAVGGFNEENKLNWDTELFIDMAMNGARFTLENQFWSSFRIHSNGITGSGRLEYLRRGRFEKQFTTIKGRSWRRVDWVVFYVLRAMKHLRSPRALVERIRKGSCIKSSGGV